MKKRSVKVLLAAAVAAGLTASVSATAWADSFTPAVEEPTADVGFPGGTALPGTPSDGNYSSAQGQDGTSYRNSRGDQPYADSGSHRSHRRHGSSGGFSGDEYSDGYSDGPADEDPGSSADGF